MMDYANNTKKNNKKRTNQRYDHRHHLDITFINKEWPAEIVDWSAQGIQVIVNAPLNENNEYEAEFRIHRMSFVADEEYEDEDYVPPVEEWSWEGKLRWMKQQKDSVVFGIIFEESLEGLHLPELPDFVKEGDLCHLKISLKDSEQN